MISSDGVSVCQCVNQSQLKARKRKQYLGLIDELLYLLFVECLVMILLSPRSLLATMLGCLNYILGHSLQHQSLCHNSYQTSLKIIIFVHINCKIIADPTPGKNIKTRTSLLQDIISFCFHRFVYIRGFP